MKKFLAFGILMMSSAQPALAYSSIQLNGRFQNCTEALTETVDSAAKIFWSAQNPLDHLTTDTMKTRSGNPGLLGINLFKLEATIQRSVMGPRNKWSKEKLKGSKSAVTVFTREFGDRVLSAALKIELVNPVEKKKGTPSEVEARVEYIVQQAIHEVAMLNSGSPSSVNFLSVRPLRISGKKSGPGFFQALVAMPSAFEGLVASQRTKVIVSVDPGTTQVVHSIEYRELLPYWNAFSSTSEGRLRKFISSSIPRTNLKQTDNK